MRWPVSQLERFWQRLQKTETDCWVWPGPVNAGGYGLIKVKRRHLVTHRYAYQHSHGEIPDGMKVLHRCDNPPCCNPAHLFLGTQADNLDDMRRKGRAVYPEKKTACHNGHLLTPENTKLYNLKNGNVQRSCRECLRVYARRYRHLRKLATAAKTD